jgi:hypothetical protein
MKSFCEDTHSFILRCWREPRELKEAAPVWRGEVEHVPTGKRIYFKNFEELKQFLTSYLPEINAGETRNEEKQERTWFGTQLAPHKG